MSKFDGNYQVRTGECGRLLARFEHKKDAIEFAHKSFKWRYVYAWDGKRYVCDQRPHSRLHVRIESISLTGVSR